MSRDRNKLIELINALREFIEDKPFNNCSCCENVWEEENVDYPFGEYIGEEEW